MLIKKRTVIWLFVFVSIILLIGGRFVVNTFNRKSPDNPEEILKPEKVVERYLLERKEQIGVLSLEINKIEEIDNSEFASKMKGSEKWNKRGWSKENLAVVQAYYSAKYDNSKVPYNSGHLHQEFYLSRKEEASEWIVFDWTSPSPYKTE